MNRSFKEVLLNCGFSQAEISRRTGISASTLGEYITNNKLPRIDKLKMLKEGLDCSYGFLMGETLAMKPENTNISKELGLSDKSIETLKKYNNRTGRFEKDIFFGDVDNTDSYTNILNQILENDKIEALLYWIRELINAPAITKYEKEKNLLDLYEASAKETDEIEKELLEKEIYSLETNEEKAYHNELHNYNHGYVVGKREDIAEYKISQIFNDMIQDIFHALAEEQYNRWKVVKTRTGKNKVVPVCNDGSEYNELVGYAITDNANNEDGNNNAE